MAHRGLRFGIFLAPFHRVGDNPTLAIARDLELVSWLDHLGYDEAWIGEHHSAGWEIIASPEIFIAAAAERTKHIMLGSGVTSLPYHHPLLVAQRFVYRQIMYSVVIRAVWNAILGPWVGWGKLERSGRVQSVDSAPTQPPGWSRAT